MNDDTPVEHTESIIIVDPHAGDGVLDGIPPNPAYRTWTIQDLRASTLRFNQHTNVAVTTIAMIDDVLRRLDDDARRAAVDVLQDKYAFRLLLGAVYPDLAFQRIHLHDLPQLVLAAGTQYVIKPVRGAFATGVRTITHTTDLFQTMEDIQRELRRNSAVFSAAALSQDELILESFIDGEEYAVDMFYNRAGQPVITNIYHHPMPLNPAYLHMLYYTSHAVFERVYEPARTFFTLLNTRLRVHSLPIHAEFRFHQGRLTPIELNPLRFGGMGLGNLGLQAFGLNAYQYFAQDRAPDWDEIWHARPDMAYGFVIAYNGATTDVTTHRPNWPAFRRRFSRILHEVRFDYQRHLAFGVLYIEDDPTKLAQLLSMEFDDYFVPLDDHAAE